MRNKSFLPAFSNCLSGALYYNGLRVLCVQKNAELSLLKIRVNRTFFLFDMFSIFLFFDFS
ncbi:MAG: hypothetical protein D3910_13955 [Candidatus Electrothrix sp. ATG2]|nr:hypothetical protein [Candidatus Electrothrix sp. ATG2]